MLNQEQIEFYQQHGYLKVEALFSESEVYELSSDMVQVIENWGNETIGWQGPWRDHYLDQEERLNTKAVFMHNPHFYSSAWGRVIFNQKLVGSVQDLISNNVQWHHTVLHAKPPELGTPFPMHQDYPFYPHDGLDFVDCLLHLDDTPLESGCLEVVPGSHHQGPLEHVTGADTAPHLPTNQFHPDFVETIKIPAQAGDVIFFSYCTIHWSDCNRTDKWRKSVRFGYHSTTMRPVNYDPSTAYNNIIVSGFKTNPNKVLN